VQKINILIKLAIIHTDVFIKGLSYLDRSGYDPKIHLSLSI